MKQFLRTHKPYGLMAQFSMTIAVWGIVCIVLFAMLLFGGETLLSSYFENSEFEDEHIQRQISSLQSYIDKNQIDSTRLSELSAWQKKQPVILLELYENGHCIYSSANADTEEQDAQLYSWEETYSIALADIQVEAIIYADFTYQYYTAATAVEIILCFLLFIVLFIRSNRRLISYITKLKEDVQILEGGDLNYQISVEGNNELTELAQSMNSMRQAFRTQMQQEAAVQEINQRLVTEMSHDLRTPLTSLLLYTEILRYHKYKDESQVQDYLEKIENKARQMKELSDHIFTHSLAGEKRDSSAVQLQGMEKCLSEPIQEVLSYLKTSGFSVESELEWQTCSIMLRRDYIDRVMDNISSNIVKYAEKAAPIYVETVYTDKYAGISFMNTISLTDKEINSTHIGLESIQSMMAQMGGMCELEQTDTAFGITLLFYKQ